MTLLLDTHFLIWLLVESPRLAEFPWLDNHMPWGVSPVSFLELQFLKEVGRLDGDVPGLVGAIDQDPRLVIDEIALPVVIGHALPISWTGIRSIDSSWGTAPRVVLRSAPSTTISGHITGISLIHSARESRKGCPVRLACS